MKQIPALPDAHWQADRERPQSLRGNIMKSLKPALFLITLAVLGIAVLPVSAQETTTRKELRREDLSGAPGMEVILSITELKPGDEIPAHLHHGIETGYVLEGGMVEARGRPAYAIETGSPIMNLRDVAHGGFKVVGDKTIKLLTVHIVDKGKPLYDPVKK
jgi:quercetin dioxygenase-like cupin family protein